MYTGFRVIHWETIVTKVHSQTLMAMKSGCKIYTQNVPRLSNLPPVALDPAYTFLHILRCLKVGSFFIGIWYQSWQNSYRIYGVIFICIESNKYPNRNI